MTEQIRLHKLLARSGAASLRASERLIAEGRVTVNGVPATTPGASATPSDEIRVDGVLLSGSAPLRYVLLNKPVGVLSTAHDEMGRRTVLDLVPLTDRLYPVGRLDRESEGLMLLTNDGELAARMTHPRHGVHKRYTVELEGPYSAADLARLSAGVMLEDGLSKPLHAEYIKGGRVRSTVEIVLGEGRNRQIRRMFEALDKNVLRLVRVALGPLRLEDLGARRHRELTTPEAMELRRAIGLEASGVRR